MQPLVTGHYNGNGIVFHMNKVEADKKKERKKPRKVIGEEILLLPSRGRMEASGLLPNQYTLWN